MRKPIFRILKSKKDIKQSKPKKIIYLKKFDDFNKQTEPAVKIVYEVINNELISKLETRQNVNCSYLLE